MKVKLLSLLIILFSSCAHRNLVYMSDLSEVSLYTETIENSNEPRIQPGDLMNITISSLNPESNMLFNNGILLTGMNTGGTGNTGSKMFDGYQVDKNGYINFPIIGKIHLEGLTKEEATVHVTSLLEHYIKKPIVDVRFINFKVTVIGEVNAPSTFTIPTDRINIIEALGYAGDMTPLGKRDNVMIIREVDGVRTVSKVNLNSKEILNSPYFYLQQNDIIYVQPDKARAAQASMTRNNISMGLSIISVLTIVLTRFL